jgi:methyl-accepting chemotaxis protein
MVEAINVDITEINALNLDGMQNLESTLKACSDLETQTATLNRLVSGFRI